MTISAAILDLQTKLASLGMKIPPSGPPESANVFPFGVSYISNGRLEIESASWGRNFHTIFSEIHTSRQLLPQAISKAMSYIEPFFMLLAADPTLGDTISNIVDVRYKFGKLEWGGVETIGERFEIDVKILQEDSSPWWLKDNVLPSECVAAYRGKGAVDIATSQINLANPGTHDLVASPTPVNFDPLIGWIGNGSGRYWLTDILVDDFDWTFIVKFNSLFMNTGQTLFGLSQSSPVSTSLYMQPPTVGYVRTRYCSDAGMIFPETAEGVLAMANRTGYRIGVYGLTSFALQPAIYPLPTIPIYLMAYNNGVGASTPVNGNVTSFAVYNKELSENQILNIGKAMP